MFHSYGTKAVRGNDEWNDWGHWSDIEGLTTHPVFGDSFQILRLCITKHWNDYYEFCTSMCTLYIHEQT